MLQNGSEQMQYLFLSIHQRILGEIIIIIIKSLSSTNVFNINVP